MGANVDASTTTFAVGAFYHRPPSLQVDGIHKTDILGTQAAALTVGVHSDGNSGHAGDLGAYLGSQMGDQSPQTAAGTTMADGHQLVTWTNAQPQCVQFVASD
jgi:hypothetical protein